MCMPLLVAISHDTRSVEHPWHLHTPGPAPAPPPAGIGSRLLLRMGWRPGQGLGPARHGRLEPLVPPRRPRVRTGCGAGVG